MAIFEKPGYWGLKDPLEVRVQHETCIYMGDTFSSHFEPKKIDRVGRRGQKQPKLGIFEGTNIGQFWLFLAPPADLVEFLLFKMAGTGVLHIVLHVLCLTCTSGGYFRSQKSVLSKIATFGCFGVKIGGRLDFWGCQG